nr:hypothetical protein [Tanacetum cinerariifolium]
DDFKEFFDNSTNGVNATSTPVTAVGPNSTNSTNTFSAAALKDITYSDDDEDVGAEADFSNLETKYKCHTQEKVIDYEEVFAPVARIEAIRLFLAYASFIGFMVYQMDVKSAFLYGTIKKEVYVCQPLGFEDSDDPDKVYKVVKALYRLHQAPRAWYETLANYLLENGFQKGKIDQTLFIKKQKGELTFFLGLQVKQKQDGIYISQDKYVAEILRKFGLTDGKLASTPIDTEKPLLKDPDSKDVDVHTYRSMIGSLMYLTSSRPDIIFATVVATPSTKAEYVATASCYAQVPWIQNQLLDYGVLVTKPHNKTPYELLLGKTPSIGIMRPFGYLVTILNTLDYLGKFDGKADEGFLVGYSISSKAFRVFNSRTRIVQETLHINFLENQPNSSAGIQEHFDAGKAGEGNVQQYVLLPLWSFGSKDPQNIDADAFEVKEPKFEVHVSPSSNAKAKKHDDKTKREAKGKSSVELSTGVKNLSEEFKYFSSNSTNGVNVASTPVIAVEPNSTNSTNTFSATGPSNTTEEPKRVHQALKDPSWIEAMQEELLQFKMQKVWVLVDFLKCKRAIGSKWVFRNKKDERGIV